MNHAAHAAAEIFPCPPEYSAEELSLMPFSVALGAAGIRKHRRFESVRAQERAMPIIQAAIDAALAERDAEIDAIKFAAHMPDDYQHGLPSWINQRLYAAYIGLHFSPEVMEQINSGALTFPESPAERRALRLARALVYFHRHATRETLLAADASVPPAVEEARELLNQSSEGE